MIYRKILLIAFLFSLIWVWNRYVPEFIIKSVGNFHRNFNKANLEKQPIKFALKQEDNFIKFAKYFYWLGFLVVSYAILISEI